MEQDNHNQPQPAAPSQPQADSQPQQSSAQQSARESPLELTVASLNLDEATAAAVRQILQPMASTANADIARLIATAIRHDDDVKNAETAGYLRGRNEKIELVNHIEQEPAAEPSPVNFPRYNKRSFWD